MLTSPNARRLYAIHRLSPYLLLSLPISSRQITCTLSVFYIVRLSKCVLFRYISSFCDYNRFTVCKYTFTFLFKRWRDVFCANALFPSADWRSEMAAGRPHHGRPLYHRVSFGFTVIRRLWLPLSQTQVYLSLPRCLRLSLKGVFVTWDRPWVGALMDLYRRLGSLFRLRSWCRFLGVLAVRQGLKICCVKRAPLND